ncbi:MAG TPA: ParM/StbA family protein [Symbiobacteriaceae bacterium]|jgi:plasmid segregation protein ParM
MVKPVGIDVGYGFVKAYDKQEWFTFPSVVGLAGDTPRYGGLNAGSKVRNMSITLDGQDYHVGEQAVRQSTFAFRSLSQSRLEANEFKVLCLTGLGLMADRPNTSMNVVTGLPPGLMYQEAKIMQMLRGDHRVALRLGKDILERTISVENVQVFPQPMGTYFAEVLDSKGQVKDDTLVSSRVAVVDIGYGTTDLAVVDAGEYVPHLSRSVPVGFAAVSDVISEKLRREFGLLRESYVLDQAVSAGSLKVAGQTKDITPIRDLAYKGLATKLLTEIFSSWDPRAMDTIIFTGGGSKPLEPYLLPHFTNAHRVDPGQTANARGFLLWADRLSVPAAPEFGRHMDESAFPRTSPR